MVSLAWPTSDWESEVRGLWAVAFAMLITPAFADGPATVRNVIVPNVTSQNEDQRHCTDCTFVGYLRCTTPPRFPGCLSNGTQQFIYIHLSWVECQAYKQEARFAGGAGGACF
jgi:hypothetical protein